MAGFPVGKARPEPGSFALTTGSRASPVLSPDLHSFWRESGERARSACEKERYVASACVNTRIGRPSSVLMGTLPAPGDPAGVMDMPKNLVPLDRAIRLGGGLLLVATPILDLNTFPYNLLGIIPIATALVGFCPLYSLGRMIVPENHSREPGIVPRARREATP
ncbi:MAG TPA: DUF2892 domain-containing protein, partial [Candidatus Eisenbacteria bacterium]|nr:DUF2892 domain-containing protein [Candidatus Eisenbacteria bacterium]